MRRWLRKLERDARESADTIVLLDTETGEQFEAPKGAFLYVLASLGDEETDPAIAPLLDRLDRLVVRDTGARFWLENMTWSGKTAANAEEAAE